jgi:hypothetical protein
MPGDRLLADLLALWTKIACEAAMCYGKTVMTVTALLLQIVGELFLPMLSAPCTLPAEISGQEKC